MTNITIISTDNSINVDFGDYANTIGIFKATYNKDKIAAIKLTPNSIQVSVQEEKEWQVNFDGSGGSLMIDTINSVYPTSLDDLYTKLIALIA